MDEVEDLSHTGRSTFRGSLITNSDMCFNVTALLMFAVVNLLKAKLSHTLEENGGGIYIFEIKPFLCFCAFCLTMSLTKRK